MSRFHVLCGLLAAANIGMAVHVIDLYAGATARTESVGILPQGITAMKTMRGQPVGPLKGRIVVLAFARASDAIALEQIRKVSSGADADLVKVILFSDRPSAVSASITGEGIAIVSSSHLQWATLVNASNNVERWSVYDQRGVQRVRGNFNRGGLEGAVGKVLGTTPEYSVTMLTAHLQPHLAGDGSGFVDDVPSPTSDHVVLFVGQMMIGCPISNALRTIDDAAAGAEGISFSVLVPPDWLDQEIEAIKVNLSVRAPVRRAPAGVAAAWRDLHRVYGATAHAGFFVRFRPGSDPQVLTETKPLLRIFDAGTP